MGSSTSMILQLLTCLSILLHHHHVNCTEVTEVTHPTECALYRDQSLQAVTQCFEQFFVTKGSLSPQQWAAMVPNEAEVKAYQQLLFSVLNGTLACHPDSVPPVLIRYLTMRPFGKQFEHCIIYENSVSAERSHQLLRGFPLVYIRLCGEYCSLVHHGAAHFESDGLVHLQAAAVYEQSDSRSAVISTLRRDAVDTEKSACDDRYWPTDGAHNVNTLYHAANVAVFGYQSRQGCPSHRCAFIEWHGKRSTSCPDDPAFISAGLPLDSGIYDLHLLPANELASHVNDIWRSQNKPFVANTPAESACFLLATRNVFGRLVNGAPRDQLCAPAERRKVGTGHFVHVEQAIDVRVPVEFADWARAVSTAFRNPPADRQILNRQSVVVVVDSGGDSTATVDTTENTTTSSETLATGIAPTNWGYLCQSNMLKNIANVNCSKPTQLAEGGEEKQVVVEQQEMEVVTAEEARPRKTMVVEESTVELPQEEEGSGGSSMEPLDGVGGDEVTNAMDTTTTTTLASMGGTDGGGGTTSSSTQLPTTTPAKDEKNDLLLVGAAVAAAELDDFAFGGWPSENEKSEVVWTEVDRSPSRAGMMSPFEPDVGLALPVASVAEPDDSEPKTDAEASPSEPDVSPSQVDEAPAEAEVLLTEVNRSPSEPGLSPFEPDAGLAEPVVSVDEPETGASDSPSQPDVSPSEVDESTAEAEVLLTEVNRSPSEPGISPFEPDAGLAEPVVSVDEPETEDVASPSEPDVSPAEPERSPYEPDVLLTEVVDSPIPGPGYSPFEPDAGLAEPVVAADEPENSPAQTEASPSEPDISSPEPDVSPSEPDVSPPEPDNSPSEPDVSSPEPDVSPSEPDVSPSEPDVSPPEPDVSQTDPDVSPSEPDVSPEEPEDDEDYGADMLTVSDRRKRAGRSCNVSHVLLAFLLLFVPLNGLLL